MSSVRRTTQKLRSVALVPGAIDDLAGRRDRVLFVVDGEDAVDDDEPDPTGNVVLLLEQAAVDDVILNEHRDVGDRR